MTTDIQPGDVLLVRTTTGGWLARTAGWIIRLGQAIEDAPNTWNHVIVAHHIDAAGTFWGIEGRPGGVGWTDLGPWLADRWTITNRAQAKEPGQRSQVCDAALALIGRPYDWGGIVVDAMRAIAPLWQLRQPGGWEPGVVPGQVVCSSLADWVYQRAGLASPPTGRWCTPADWAGFILARGWE
jgi:cell wall-associated NlpC family hydrolase